MTDAFDFAGRVSLWTGIPQLRSFGPTKGDLWKVRRVHSHSSPARLLPIPPVSTLPYHICSCAPIVSLAIMDELGLPSSFRKSSLPSKPSSSIESQPSALRGGPAGRGPRGAVGGGKRSRGRGRGGDGGRGRNEGPDTGYTLDRDHGSQSELNGEVKVGSIQISQINAE